MLSVKTMSPNTMADMKCHGKDYGSEIIWGPIYWKAEMIWGPIYWKTEMI